MVVANDRHGSASGYSALLETFKDLLCPQVYIDHSPTRSGGHIRWHFRPRRMQGNAWQRAPGPRRAISARSCGPAWRFLPDLGFGRLRSSVTGGIPELMPPQPVAIRPWHGYPFTHPLKIQESAIEESKREENFWRQVTMARARASCPFKLSRTVMRQYHKPITV